MQIRFYFSKILRSHSKIVEGFIIILLLFQLLCVYVGVRIVIRMRSGEKVMTTSLKDIESHSDYPVFTFCSKNQYRNKSSKSKFPLTEKYQQFKFFPFYSFLQVPIFEYPFVVSSN